MKHKMKIYKMITCFLAGLTTCILLACDVSPAGNNNSPENSEPADVNEVVKGNTEFALELYGKLAETPEAEGKNLFFSPYSISTALALTYAGARGDTEEQMAQVLHFEPAGQRIHPAFGLLEKQLNEKGAEGVFELAIANALWGQKGYKFLDSFISLVNSNYSAGLNEVDFINETENSRVTINEWIEEKTREKIKDLIKPGVLDRLTRLVLTNAIYFKGKWQYEFDKKDTRDAPFHISARNTVTVPIMYIKKEFNFTERDDLQILELGYKGEALSMIIILPNEIDGAKKLEKQLTVENLNNWLDVLRKREVEVYLPKFTFTSEFELKKILSQMGMPKAFSGSADFSGMTGGKDLSISNVLHKAFVEVNEEGTEAAAATAVVMMTTSIRSPIPIFRANRPFIFLIKDNQTGSILFMGKVVDPGKK